MRSEGRRARMFAAVALGAGSGTGSICGVRSAMARMVPAASTGVRADGGYDIGPLEPPSPPRCCRKRSISPTSSSPVGSSWLSTTDSRRSTVGPRVVVGLDDLVQPLSLRHRLVGEPVERWLDAEVPPEVFEDRDRRGRVGAAHVVRHLRVEADGPAGRRPRRPSRSPTTRRGHPEQAGRPDLLVVVQQPSSDAVASTGTGRVWGTAVGIAPRLTPLRHPESPRDREHVAPELLATGSRARRR